MTWVFREDRRSEGLAGIPHFKLWFWGVGVLGFGVQDFGFWGFRALGLGFALGFEGLQLRCERLEIGAV